MNRITWMAIAALVLLAAVWATAAKKISAKEAASAVTTTEGGCAMMSHNSMDGCSSGCSMEGHDEGGCGMMHSKGAAKAAPKDAAKATTATGNATTGKGAAAKEETALYTCPMHPEVKSAKPGKCPKCGMNLGQTKR